MEQKKKAAVMLIAFGAVVAGLAIASSMKGGRTGEEETPGNVYTDVPDAEVNELSGSKSDAYMTYSESSRSIEDYWNDCEDEYAAAHPEEDIRTSSGGNGEEQHKATSEELFGSAPSQTPAKSGGSSANPYRESAREREARHQKRREETIDLVNQMSGQSKTEEEDKPSEPVYETINIPSSEVRRSDVISSLDDSWSDGGVSSLDGKKAKAAEDELHPFKCMFVREEKIKSGQRVSVRLLEDIVVGGVLIPKNSHLMASCNLTGRLELEIANVEIQGRILSLGYEAYDTDGTKGIYCPDAGSAGKTARSRGTNLAGTALTSRVGRLASDVVTTGVSLIESATGERTVTVPAGYAFYIVKKKQ
jgi:Protein of unknown function (DUF3714).